MTTKEYLGQIRILDMKINNKLVEIEQAKELACSISAISYEERVQTTPNFDKIGTALCKIEKMQEHLNNLIDKYVDKKAEIIEQIENLENGIHRTILFMRYIEGKKFIVMENEVGYSYRNLLRHYNKALNSFEKKYGDLYLNN